MVQMILTGWLIATLRNMQLPKCIGPITVQQRRQVVVNAFFDFGSVVTARV